MRTSSVARAVVAVLTVLVTGGIGVPVRADDVAGRYVLHGVMETASELRLAPDGTFEFALIYGAADYWSKGTWQRDGDAVVLTTTGRKGPPFRPLRSQAVAGGRVVVHLQGTSGRPVENVDVSLHAVDREIQGRTNEKGVMDFGVVHNPRAVVWMVTVYDVRSEPFALNPAHNDFYFEVDGAAVSRVDFQGDRATLQEKGLMLTFPPRIGRPMRYERQ